MFTCVLHLCFSYLQNSHLGTVQFSDSKESACNVGYTWVGKILWRRKWQPTPVLLPGKSHGWRSLAGYSPRGRKELDMIEQLHYISFFRFSSNGLVVSDSVTPWTAAHQASLSITISQSLLKPMSIESVMPSNHLILCRPLLLLPSIFPSIRVFFQ